MKKNVMMRLAAILLVCVLASTCGISGTYAKYVTSGTSTDTARVAKWGVEIITNGKMFGEHYYAYDNNNISAAYTGSVDSQGDINANGYTKIVAPGTKGDMVEVDLEGKPEVKVEVSYEAEITLAGWTADGSEYFPIIFTINGETYGLDYTTATNKYANTTLLLEAIYGVIDGYTKTYNAGTNLEDVAYEALSISWEWPFETYKGGVLCDALDTELGDAGTLARIDITVTTTVTQVD